MNGRTRRARRIGVAASVAVHLALAAVLLIALGRAPAYAPNDPLVPIPVTLERLPRPEAPPKPAGGAPAPPAAVTAAPPAKVRPAQVPPPTVQPLLVATAPEPLPSLSDAEAAGARTAGSGGGEGGGSGSGGGGESCDMVRRLQGALRRDPQVRAAAAGAHRATGGRAIVVWNGDWVRDPAQAGKGLAGVRQAIALEVAFAPEACRDEPMRGLVVLSMADAPGAPRLALGQGAWRWTDLLARHR